MHRSHTSCF